jgi:hypothetical protein
VRELWQDMVDPTAAARSQVRRDSQFSGTQLFVDGESSRRLAKDYHRSVEAIRHRCRVSCRELVDDQKLPDLPAGTEPLVLVGDGLWFRFKRKNWVAYSMAVKPTGTQTAHFLDPVMLAGREDAKNWLAAIATIPPAVGERIRALVADGFRGAKMITRQRRWILQLCHRHLDAKLLGRPGRRRKVRGEAVRGMVLAMIREARSTTDQARMVALQEMLAECARHPDLTSRISGITRRFLHDIVLYRAYLAHAELELPTTTNAIESRHSQLRQVVIGINRPLATELRLRAYTRLHPTITCNVHVIPQN